MRVLLIFTIIFTLNLEVQPQEVAHKESIETNLFVWAKNGLNVRSGPGTKHAVVDWLKYGDEVEVKSITDVSFNMNGIPVQTINNSGFMEPYILYGQWVEIITKRGHIGFVISQYLIDLKPSKKPLNYGNSLNLDVQSIDTIFARDQVYDGEVLNSTIKYRYNNRISRVDNNGGVYGDMTILFDNFTIAEVFVIMDVKGESIAMIKNWKNELHLEDHGGMCEISIKRRGDKVYYYMMYSC